MMERNSSGRFAKKQLGYRKKVCPACGRKLWLREFYKRDDSKNFPDSFHSRRL
mgnify:CR=1 FL=1